MKRAFPKTDANGMDWLTREKQLVRLRVAAYNEREAECQDGVNCPLCHNKGYVMETFNDGLDTRLVRCKCQDRREIVRNANRSGLGNLLTKKLSDYHTTQEWQIQAKNAAIDYLENPSGWFVMLGQPGSGKTLLCGIVAAQLLRKGFRVEFKSWPELVRETNVEWYEEKEVLRRWKEVPVLYIDDFLKTGITDRTIQIAYEILNYRYNYNLLTIISGEKGIRQTQEIDEAIASRMVEKAGSHLITLKADVSKNQRLRGKGK